MKRNSELRTTAYAAMEGHWGMSALITLVYYVLAGGLSFVVPKVGGLVNIVLLPMSWAYYVIFLRLARKEETDFSQLFDGFSNQYFRYLGTLLLQGIYILLWSLLLIVPGIMKACSYAMTPFIPTRREVEL